jgi:hypothetical protein
MRKKVNNDPLSRRQNSNGLHVKSRTEKVPIAALSDRIQCEQRLFLFEFCLPTYVLDDVPRIASPEGLTQFRKDLYELVHDGGVIYEAGLRANPARDLVELFVGYITYLDLALDSSHEGFVGQADRIQVRRKDHNQIKGDFEFGPARQG